MSHFGAVVFISPQIANQEVAAITTAIERLMVPYDLKTLTKEGELNPQGEWDSWKLDSYGTLGDCADQKFANTELAGNGCWVKNLSFDYVPFAVITPDGEWHKEGQMGMFGFSSDHDPYWEDKFDQMREQYANCLAVALDCHI